MFLLVLMVTVSLYAAEIDSEPKLGQAESVLKVKDLAGQHEGKVVAWFAEAQVNETSIRPVLQAIQKAVE